MSFVSKFEREVTSPYYRVLACKKGDESSCSTLPFQYHLLLNHTKSTNADILSTKNGGYYFMDKDEIRTQKRKQFLEKERCWKIDPCTPSIASHCCDTGFTDSGSPYIAPGGSITHPNGVKVETREVENVKETKPAKKEISMTFLVLFFVITGFLVFGFIAVILTIR